MRNLSFLIVEGLRNIQAFKRRGVETVTLSKHVAEYEQMRTWMVEFVSKFQGRGIKITRVKLIRIANPNSFRTAAP